MKILCLHGNYMSGTLFAFQTAAFRRLLGNEHEYVFPDGQIESNCLPGVEVITKGPYYRWTTGTTSPDISAAHEYIHSIIEEDGPFDGVIGISQGAALATSILLQHEIDHQNEAPPFSFAILFSCFLVCSPDKNFAQQDYEMAHKSYVDAALKGLKGQDIQEDEVDDGEIVEENVSGKWRKKSKVVKAPTHRSELVRSSKRAALVAEIADVVASSVRLAALYQGENADLPVDASGGLEGIPRVYHHLIMDDRVKVPTAYIVGRHDPFEKHWKMAKPLFEKDCLRFVEHSGAHDMPRLEIELKAAAAAARWAIQRSRISTDRRWYQKKSGQTHGEIMRQ